MMRTLSITAALLLLACGQVLGLKDFKDAPSEGSGGAASASGGSTSSKGGSSDASGGDAPGAAGGAVSSGGSGNPGVGGSAPGAGGTTEEAGAGGSGATGTGGSGPASGGTPSITCTADGNIVDVFGPPELDVSSSSAGGTQSEINDETLVVVGDSSKVHVGIQRMDGQYVVRSLTDGSGGNNQPLLIWTKMAGDDHRFTRGRVRLNKLEFYGTVRDSMALLQVPLGSNGIAPGASNSAVVETLVRRPCAMDMFPANHAVSFHSTDYSIAFTCENSTTLRRSLTIYESIGDSINEVASGDVNDNTLRVQGYVWVPGSPLIQVGDGGSAMLRLGRPPVGVSQATFSLDFGTGLSALFGITENQGQTGAQILAASLTNPGLVPARMQWASVAAENYPSLASSPLTGFSEVGVFRAVSDVGEPGRPAAGDWGMWLVGHSKQDEMNTSPGVMRGTWIGPQGATLVFNQTLHQAQGSEVLRRAYATRIGIAGTYVIWLENVPDPSTPSDLTPRLHRVRAQRFTCAAAQ
ncbi:MAG: hypothetical protein QM756_39030 [Polyangiaceae bacterium]